MAHRYLFDTNTLVSGILWGGNESRLIVLANVGKFRLITSEYILTELERVLGELSHDHDRKRAENSVMLIRNLASEIIDVSESEVSVCQNDVSDKKDAEILAACIKSKAVLVTGDKKFAKEAALFIEVVTSKELLDSLKR